MERDFLRKVWSDKGCAREEHVAKLGSVFLCADLELVPKIRDNHASYSEAWLEVLKNDKCAIFQAASRAQKAVDFLNRLQQPVAEAGAA